jgi:hypothetical protein
MTKDNLPFRDRRVTGAPVYDPAIPAPVLRLPAISHEEVLAILADRPIRKPSIASLLALATLAA